MIILAKYKFLQKLIGLDPLGGLENIVVRFIYWLLLFSTAFLISVFFFLNIHDDIHRAWGALTALIAFTTVVTTYSHLLICRHRFYSLLDELQDIVNERAMKDDNEVIYVGAEQRVSFVTNFIIRASILIPTMSLMPFILAAYNWYTGNYTIHSWFFYFPVWTPFELNTTTRCALMVLYETLGATCGPFVFYSVPSMLFALMIYSEACFLDIKSLFVQVDHLSNPKVDRSPQPSESHPPDAERKKAELLMLERCQEIVALHQRFNRLMKNLADIMNFVILLTISSWSMCICTSLLLIAKYSGSNILFDLPMPVVGTVFPLILLAILFYLGENFHTISMDLTDVIYQTKWYQYPHSVRRFLVLMMIRSQKPFYLSAYGIMKLNLEHFVRLLKWMYSAYMVLGRID